MLLKNKLIISLFVALSAVVFLIEAAIPPLTAVPGIKLGLANIFTMLMLIYFSKREALILLLIRIILCSFIFGQAITFFYSLLGGIFSIIAILISFVIFGEKYIFISSVFGGIFHNVGQIIAAYLMLGFDGIFIYLPYLIVGGVLAGLFTGLICYFSTKYLDPVFERI